MWALSRCVLVRGGKTILTNWLLLFAYISVILGAVHYMQTWMVKVVDLLSPHPQCCADFTITIQVIGPVHTSIFLNTLERIQPCCLLAHGTGHATMTFLPSLYHVLLLWYEAWEVTWSPTLLWFLPPWGRQSSMGCDLPTSLLLHCTSPVFYQLS